VQKAEAQPEFSLDDFASAGVADAADMWNEPQAQPPSMPTFELDEAEAAAGPTLEIPATALREPERAPAPPPPSAWDEPEEEPVPAPTPVMPAWDSGSRKRTPVAVPTPAAAELRPTAAEEEWGFDDAQLETAKRASAPAAPVAATPRTTTRSPISTPKKPKSKSHFGLLITLMIVFILAGGGYYGFLWYQNQREPEPAPVAAVPKRTPGPAAAQPPAVAPSTATIVETTTTAPSTPAPMQITATVPEATTTTQAPQALPAVIPRQSGASRYESMALEFAANPTGNFTVQIQILCETSNLDKAMRLGGNNVWFVPQAIGTRSCYRVFWGRYATREEAQRALASIPADLRDRSAAVKPIPRQ
jgi:hypothetical protein